MNKGQHGELQAKKYLERQGLSTVEQNVRYPFGELDLVMRHKNNWVFVEVKLRTNPNFGGAISAVSNKQIQRIRKAANFYLQQKRIQAPCRFDVIAIDNDKIQWVQGAF